MRNNNLAVKRTFSKRGVDNHAQGFRRDDPEDRGKFIESHMPLVISIARKRLNNGMELEDLVQEGILGLITAADKFDASKGFRFSTYATWWIRQAVDDALLKHGDTVKKPSNYASHLKTLLRARNGLEKKLGRLPSTEEIAEDTEMDKRMIRQLMSLIPGTVSLDTPISAIEETSSNYMDVLEDRNAESPAEHSIAGQLRADLLNALDSLSEREREIISLRFGLNSGEGRSLREVGRIFSLSPERIRQIEECAINKLRKTDVNYILREYLN